MTRGRGATIDLVIPVPLSDDRWVLEEENMPETPLHQRISDLLMLVLQAWIARTGRDAMAGSNIALRWNRAKPNVGVDPDVYLVEPAPPLRERETSLCLWKKGHHAPRLAVEVVSQNTADKDYRDAPARYAASGTRELWVFDPLKLGPAESASVLQVWRRVAKGRFEKVYAGDGPAFSRELGAWVVVTDDGMRLRIANDAAGKQCWPTAEEEALAARADAERAKADAERAKADAERAKADAEQARDAERRRREAAEAELAQLRAAAPKKPRARGAK